MNSTGYWCARCDKMVQNILGLPNCGQLCLPCAESKTKNNWLVCFLVTFVCTLGSVFITITGVPSALLALIPPLGLWMMCYQDQQKINETKTAIVLPHKIG